MTANFEGTVTSPLHPVLKRIDMWATPAVGSSVSNLYSVLYVLFTCMSVYQLDYFLTFNTPVFLRS